jgi:hypothetical protein
MGYATICGAKRILMFMNNYNQTKLLPKYDMTRAENIEYAKRNIVDYIYGSAVLEGLAVTFPDTDAIYNGMLPTGNKVTVDDVLAVNNLKHAWQFLFDTLDVPNDYAYVCKINQYVGDGHLFYNAGFIRQLDVRIGGTNWRPEIPNEFVVKEKLLSLSNVENPMDKALDTTLYLMRSQLFFDGNKRTAMLIGNKIMIENGLGVLTVNPYDVAEFKTELIKYYESGNINLIKQYLYERSIDGTDFTNDRHREDTRIPFDAAKLEAEKNNRQNGNRITAGADINDDEIER